MPIFGALFLCLTVAGAIAGASAPVVAGMLSMSVLALVGIGRRFGTAVDRTPTEVVCRFAPLLEGNTYLPFVLVAFFLAVDVAERPSGLARLVTPLAALLALAAAGGVWRTRRCRLAIGPAALTVSVAKPGMAPIVIAREEIESITTATVSPGSGRVYVPQTEIVYRRAQAATSAAIQIGLSPASPETRVQLTVRPLCLEQALTEWRNGSADDPELLDRVESLLRGSEAEETSLL